MKSFLQWIYVRTVHACICLNSADLFTTLRCFVHFNSRHFNMWFRTKIRVGTSRAVQYKQWIIQLIFVFSCKQPMTKHYTVTLSYYRLIKQNYTMYTCPHFFINLHGNVDKELCVVLSISLQTIYFNCEIYYTYSMFYLTLSI